MPGLRAPIRFQTILFLITEVVHELQHELQHIANFQGCYNLDYRGKLGKNTLVMSALQLFPNQINTQ